MECSVGSASIDFFVFIFVCWDLIVVRALASSTCLASMESALSGLSVSVWVALSGGVCCIACP